MRLFVCFFLIASAAQTQEPLTERERLLLQRIDQLDQRIAALEAKLAVPPALHDPVPSTPVSTAVPAPEARPPANLGLDGTTINLTLDGYYGYNFNRPAGAVNLLRAYDVSSNSFSLNQASIIVERAPDLSAGRRWGGRLDLMFGQATETQQGSPANEARPQVYRHIFQAYGTYVAPVGKGLTVDFGKWASALGIEGNYTKDQLNYSRAYWFNFLPFYHFGTRANYAFNEKINVGYWLVNGIGQSEDFNGFKSQAVLFNVTPHKTLTFNLNYYTGQEGRAWQSSVPSTLPTQPGLSTTPVTGRAPTGRTHIIDTYLTWTPTSRWTLSGELDNVISRTNPQSPPQRVNGGVAYVRYRFTPRFNLAGRYEYLRDRAGLFSGVSQRLQETTVTATYDVAPGMQVRGEYRRDFSNAAFFLTANPNQRKREQSTALLGLVWWFGGKQGTW